MREHHNAHINLWNKIDQWTLKARKYERTTLERKLKKVEYDSDDSDDLSIKNKKLEKKLKKYKAKLDKK